MNLKTALNFNMPIYLQIGIGFALFFLVVCIPFMLKYKNHFFGWENFKWLIVEFRKMYSNEPSHFSYKRFQMGSAYFMFTQGAMYALTNFCHNINDFLLWCVPVLLISGYTLNLTQKEKIADKPNEQG